MTEIKNDKYDNRILSDFDEAFSTLDLVNATDMDAFLKVLISVDEKVAQNIRGELNHVVAKYIDTDPELKKKLQENKLHKFSIKYLQDSFYLLRKNHLKLLNDNLFNTAMSMITNSGSILLVFKHLDIYALGIRKVLNSHLIETDEKIKEKFIRNCTINETFLKEIQDIHMCVVRITNIIDPNYNISKLCIVPQLDPEHDDDGKLYKLYYSFLLDHSEVDHIRNIIQVPLLLAKLDKSIVKQITDHYEGSENEGSENEGSENED